MTCIDCCYALLKDGDIICTYEEGNCIVTDLIHRLEKENAELKEKNKWYSEQVCDKECAEVWGNLSKAKEIIRDLLSCLYSVEYDRVSDLEVAEQFLKEE